jgi:hypothetical protein
LRNLSGRSLNDAFEMNNPLYVRESCTKSALLLTRTFAAKANLSAIKFSSEHLRHGVADDISRVLSGV